MELPSESGEKIRVYTDRPMYATSERIRYSAYYQKPSQTGDLDWSSVLYVELIQWDGTKLAQSKSPIKDGYSEGTLVIPDELSSGNYYLRAYTRWMRNYSPYLYSYLPVKIINPRSILIEKGPENGEYEARTRIGNGAVKSKGVSINGLKESYGKRQRVELELRITDRQYSGTYNLSVAKGGSVDDSNNSFSYMEPDRSYAPREIEFLPELNGLSVSGKIINKLTGAAVPDKKINLSSYSGSFYFSSVSSTQDGSFTFLLPGYVGKHEFHVAKEDDSDEEYQILVTNEFCNQAITLPYLPFLLDEQEKSKAKEIILNAQLDGRYLVHDASQAGKEKIPVNFYGIAGTVTHEKDFIELDNVEEFFYELVYNVRVGTIRKKPYIMVAGPSSLVAFPPLILMDNIPVPNIESLLKAPCNRINRVEVIPDGFVIGDYKHKGIISIFSDKRDMAGIELSGESQFFNYQLYGENDFIFPDYSESAAHSPVADRRNLLHWEPCLELSGKDTVKISFYTSDAPGEYVVHLRSLRRDGIAVLFETARFEVK